MQLKSATAAFADEIHIYETIIRIIILSIYAAIVVGCSFNDFSAQFNYVFKWK